MRISTMVCHTASLSGWLCISTHQGRHLHPYSALPFTCLILVHKASCSPNIPTAHHYLELSFIPLQSRLSHHPGINFHPWHTRPATGIKAARNTAVLSQRYKDTDKWVRQGKSNASRSLFSFKRSQRENQLFCIYFFHSLDDKHFKVLPRGCNSSDCSVPKISFSHSSVLEWTSKGSVAIRQRHLCKWVSHPLASPILYLYCFIFQSHHLCLS